MVLLIVGVAIWWVAHLFKSVGAPVRSKLLERLGEEKIKGVVALPLLGSVVLMVLGWRATTPSVVYDVPAWGRQAAVPLMFVALFLFAASVKPNAITSLLRHPQLTGFATWAAAHLLANGDQRSLVLFGGLGAWAIVAILAINRRDGPWKRPEKQPLMSALGPLVGAAVGVAALWFAHPWLSGVKLAL